MCPKFETLEQAHRSGREVLVQGPGVKFTGKVETIDPPRLAALLKGVESQRFHFTGGISARELSVKLI